MSLSSGTRVGVYEVVSPLGVGGMGEVYRARDTRLDRHVAIKILQDSFAGDSDRLARFEREAKLLASLNHPHIAQIYGLEDSGQVRALVMELVDGGDGSPIGSRGVQSRWRSPGDRPADCRGAGSRARAGHHPSRPETGQHQAAA